jgi:hypothetical protein
MAASRAWFEVPEMASRVGSFGIFEIDTGRFVPLAGADNFTRASLLSRIVQQSKAVGFEFADTWGVKMVKNGRNRRVFWSIHTGESVHIQDGEKMRIHALLVPPTACRR